MRSITRLAGTALLGATLALAVPAVAHAAPARPQVDPADCAKAVAAAAKGQLQYDAAVADFAKAAAAAAGQPDKSRQEQLERAKNEMGAAASAAAEACPDARVLGGEGGSDKSRPDAEQAAHGSAAGDRDEYAEAPSGSMHTGAGGTSGNATAGGIALGVGLFAAGASLVVRRRRLGAGRG
ncbi:hypothetical protein [Embleya sp. NPDC020886]|uniref:hypothetical protein n=1 Tax=Embleya sp. NPDC020886 TaxID=3363980 RepID=UPI0037A65399